MACRLSQRVEYAVRALIELALAKESGLSGSQISTRAGIPNPFLKQILAMLVKGRVIESTRGRQGRYKLVLSPDEISLYRLLDLIEGGISFYDPGSPPGVATQAIYHKLSSQLVGLMDNITLKDFLLAAQMDRSESNPMFFI
ncbi:MAG: RrF2 family transcriptional regulator [Leptospirales bacterium]